MGGRLNNDEGAGDRWLGMAAVCGFVLQVAYGDGELIQFVVHIIGIIEWFNIITKSHLNM